MKAPNRSWRRLLLGLGKLFGRHPRGFFIPHRLAGLAAREKYTALESLFDAALPEMRAWIARLSRHEKAFLAIGSAPPPEPRWDQDWFPRLDAAMAYAMVREARPRRIVEIGAGHSTRFMARAVRDGGLATEIHAFDPAPRAVLSELSSVRLDNRPLQAVFGDLSLAPGDLLFVDSSHVLMPGTDVDIILNDLLPATPPGSLVHFHDIFLPESYPAEWHWRGYNEQAALAPLLAGGGWRIEFASHVAVARLAKEIATSPLARLPLPAGAHETSLWLRRL